MKNDKEQFMKHLTKQNVIMGQMILYVVLFSNFVLYGQENEIEEQDEINEVLQELTEEMGDLERELSDELSGLKLELIQEFDGLELGELKINFGHTGDVRLGLYLNDINFEDAYEKHYPNCYGVLVSGVTTGGNGQKAGLIKGDIIMEFDGEKVLFEDHLISLRDSKNIGDTIEMTIFRNGKILDKTLTLNPPQPKIDEHGVAIIHKKKKSVGYGGGGPLALIFDYDLGLNGILEANNFQGLDSPLVVYGGYGMGNVGKGLFIGGMGAGTQLIQQIPYTDPETNVQGYKRYQLDFGFGGVTVTKKYQLFSKKVILDFGLLLGGGQTKLTMATSDGVFAWDSVVQDMNSNAFQFEKNFFVYRPSAGILIRVNSWFGVTASAGYLGTYSPDNEWKESNFDFTVAGDTPEAIGHTSYTIGVWFGN